MNSIKQLFFDYEYVKCQQCNNKIKIKKTDDPNIKKFCSVKCVMDNDNERRKNDPEYNKK